MRRKDIGLKEYLSDARRYADLWNGSVFQGKQILKAEELIEADSVVQKTEQKNETEKTVDLIRKQYRDGKQFAVFILENQEKVNYGMPAHVMIKEALQYNKQMREIARKNKSADKAFFKGEGNKVYADSDERLYRIKKEDRLHPVVTMVVYWGKEEWTGAKNLHDMIDFGENDSVSAELKKMVPEYPLHFLDLSKLEHTEYFKTELRPLLELSVRKNEKKAFIKYIEDNEDNWSMDDESWCVLSDLTKSKELKDLIDNKINSKNKDGEEGKSMCKALIDMQNDAKAEGKAEDIIELLEEYGEMPEELKAEIFEQKDLEILKKWHKFAAKASGIQEFVEKMKERFREPVR